jgi:minor extracellular serine protease Vpr
VLGAALASALPAGASLVPVRRTSGERSLPLVRAGTVHVPAGHGSGRVRVIATLAPPPLAAWAAARKLAARAAPARLDVAGAASRAYLARLSRAQRRVEARLRRAIPEARVSRRFRIVLDGLAVTLPVTRLPALVRLPFVRRAYPSLRYTLALDRSPSVIGADVLARETGALGEGVKIGVVDDGVDATNPFLRATGFRYPPGFPRGNAAFTTEKVIVARAFPGPGSGKPGRLPVDRKASFHGTHVAGIAAGDVGTDAPPGDDHPAVSGLAGVAPRAWLGNYRVFTVPTPVGNVANTPEIVAAFEAAVADGMDVVNFSGGGPETEPANDALVEAVRNVANAGVVPVIAAGNDRDDFGLGTVGSPGTAPDAISVAAVSNTHVFAPALSVTTAGAPASLRGIPVQAGPNRTPAAWAVIDQTLVDVGSVVGVSGHPVDRGLCAEGRDPNDVTSDPLPAGSLNGLVALVSRGTCTFASKEERARLAGAIGIVYVDNRPGEANPLPLELPIPAVMVSDLDGARLRAYLGGTGGRAPVRLGTTPLELETGRGGVVTSFSSAGPTAFGHDLKPDLAAPGGQVLSSTLPEFAGSPFAVFDGTSMATPHASGSAALLLQLHPGWTPRQVKSALMSTAGAAWGDTARTAEASVLLEGAGLVSLPDAADPKLFTEPASLSFGRLRSGSAGLPLRVTDAGGGGGTWQVGVEPQAAPNAQVDVPSQLAVPPGGEADLAVVVRATGAGNGEDYGFVVLSRNGVRRRIPYDVLVDRPALASAPALPLRLVQSGQTVTGESRAARYCCPAAPFGPAPDYTGSPMDENGAEALYVTRLGRPAANMGVSVTAASRGAEIDPFFLGSPDENDVQGYAGTPVNVNNLTFDFGFAYGAAGASFPLQRSYYVAVDSGTDDFTGERLAGRYVLRSWVDDVRPPAVRILTTRVAAGRPTLVARVRDAGSGVDPLSLVIGYRRALVGATAYDPVSGLAVFVLPRAAPPLTRGATRTTLVASDFQEGKNVNTVGEDVMPNTAFRAARLRVVGAPAVTWLAPAGGGCVAGRQQLLVAASSTARVRSVRFLDGGRRLGVDRSGPGGLFAAAWRTGGTTKGGHVLRAVVRDARGHTATAARAVRVCR